jgi:endo-1,4-beta-xylanase
MELTRREAFAGGIAALAGGSLQASVPGRSASLDSLARQSGRRFGAAVAWGPRGADRGSFNNPLYAAILKRECQLLVPENELKWQWTRPGPDRFDFRQFDAIADYAARHKFKLRGHTLFWTPAKWYPKWLAETHFRSAGEA